MGDGHAQGGGNERFIIKQRGQVHLILKFWRFGWPATRPDAD
jgi:hypothetical protein